MLPDSIPASVWRRSTVPRHTTRPCETTVTFGRTLVTGLGVAPAPARSSAPTGAWGACSGRAAADGARRERTSVGYPACSPGGAGKAPDLARACVGTRESALHRTAAKAAKSKSHFIRPIRACSERGTAPTLAVYRRAAIPRAEPAWLATAGSAGAAHAGQTQRRETRALGAGAACGADGACPLCESVKAAASTGSNSQSSPLTRKKTNAPVPRRFKNRKRGAVT